MENTILNIDGVDLAQVIPFLQNKNTIMLAFYSGSLSENDLKEKLSKNFTKLYDSFHREKIYSDAS